MEKSSFARIRFELKWIRVAKTGVKGEPPEEVRVSKKYTEHDARVEGQAGISHNSLFVVLSSEGCSSSNR
jgi:hypothetical protein